MSATVESKIEKATQPVLTNSRLLKIIVENPHLMLLPPGTIQNSDWKTIRFLINRWSSIRNMEGLAGLTDSQIHQETRARYGSRLFSPNRLKIIRDGAIQACLTTQKDQTDLLI